MVSMYVNVNIGLRLSSRCSPRPRLPCTLPRLALHQQLQFDFHQSEDLHLGSKRDLRRLVDIECHFSNNIIA
jgi:hypothetical protein